MRPPPIPFNEKQRIRALQELLILDTPPEKRFDRIVQLTALEFDVPIVLISLVDENRQWFKARVGLSTCETSREISFCGHAILHRDIFVIQDAHDDERFADNPLVTGPPFIRFYAGAPLVVRTGFAIGTLCMIDLAPRRMDRCDLAVFDSLRRLVQDEINAPRC